MLDRYWQGSTSRISPEAPVPIVHVQQIEERPGGAGNVALNIAALGAKATLIGITGQDEAATSLTKLLSTAGVKYLCEQVSDFPTITKLRVLSHHQQLIRLDFEKKFQGHCLSDSLMRLFESELAVADVVVLSDYAKGTLENISPFIDFAVKLGKPVIVDPKNKDFNIYRNATLITPNLSEFEAVVGQCKTEKELIEKGMTLIREKELGALLITRGEKGMTLLQKDKPELHFSARTRQVYDVTGAGDTVVAVLAVALAAGEKLPTATTLANTAAGLVVGKLGASTINISELQQACHVESQYQRGIMTEEQLLINVTKAKKNGERIIMTNGCFDILHVGHIDYLAKAKQLGERLIVAVNDDFSTRRLKGKDRPINLLEHRMAVLSALESVDWVIPFSEDTPERLICRILPDFLVKGGDYKVEEIAGRQCVIENGGKVVVLEFKERCSTSLIIKTIRNH